MRPLGLVLTTIAWISAAARLVSSGEESEPGNTSSYIPAAAAARLVSSEEESEPRNTSTSVCVHL